MSQHIQHTVRTVAEALASLNAITLGHTTAINGIAVTRWRNGYELRTLGKAVSISAEAAALELEAEWRSSQCAR